MWFVEVNPTSGVVQPVAVLPNLQYYQQGNNALDAVGHRLFLRGVSASFVETLVTVDTTTGAVLSSVPWPVGFGDPHYDPVHANLVGLHWDGSTEWLARVTPSSGAMSDVAALVGVSFAQQGDSALDVGGHRLFVWASGPSLQPSLLVLDSDSGALLSTTVWPMQFAYPEFDSSSNDLMGLQFDGTNQWFVRINPTTTAVTMVAIVPSVVATQPGHSTFDVAGHRLYLYIGGPSAAEDLVTIDTTTGSVTTSVPWPVNYAYPEYDG
jgi:hypothetical protein